MKLNKNCQNGKFKNVYRSVVFPVVSKESLYYYRLALFAKSINLLLHFIHWNSSLFLRFLYFFLFRV